MPLEIPQLNAVYPYCNGKRYHGVGDLDWQFSGVVWRLEENSGPLNGSGNQMPKVSMEEKI